MSTLSVNTQCQHVILKVLSDEVWNEEANTPWKTRHRNENRQSEVVGKFQWNFHWWNDTNVPTQLNSLKTAVSTTLYQQYYAAFWRKRSVQSALIQVAPFKLHADTFIRLPTRSRPTAQLSVPCRLLRLSRDKICPLDLSRLWISHSFQWR